MSLQDDFNESADEWYALESGSYPAVPRAPSDDVIAVRSILPLVVSDTDGYRAQPAVAEAALLILSQSPHARELAQIALKNNYSIRIDDIAHDSATAEASGYTDHLNKRIHAAVQTDPLRLALVIAHELAHVAQKENGFEFSVLQQQPAASIRELMALEGDARAHEFIVALELSYKMKDDPDERLLFPQAIDIAMDTIGSELTKKTIAHYRPQFPDIDREEMMARIFKSFYGSLPLRAHYEGIVLQSLDTVDAKDRQNPSLFSQTFNSAAVLKKIGPYAEKAAKYLDLDAPQMAGVTAGTQAKLDLWQMRRSAAPVVQKTMKAPST